MFGVTKDDISPALSRLAATAQNPLPVMRAMGTTFKSITEGTFNSVGAKYRPLPWKSKRDGSPSNLQLTTTMAKAFHLTVSATAATVSNPMPYAAIHQFGGVIRPKTKPLLAWRGPDGKYIFAHEVTIPARPFFPIINGRLTAESEALIARAGEREIVKQAAAAASGA